MKVKKIFKAFLFLLTISVYGIINVNAANPYKQSGPYGTNCTWYAWKMASEKAGISLPGWGNAKDWYKDAKNDGYSVGTIPKNNSIIVWGNWTSYGHVGYVERVEGDVLHIWDSTGPCIDESDPTYVDCMANGVSEESDRACKAAAPRISCKYSISESPYSITGYIYLSDAPKKAPTSKQENETTTNVIKKSNNAYLNSIILSTGSIDFDKKTNEYNLEVENDVNNIKIDATTEHKKAAVEGLGKYDLVVGQNEIKLSVTAENKTKKEYVINILRKEKEDVKEEKNDAQEKNVDSKTNNNYKILLTALSVLVLGTCLIMMRKRKK